MPRRKRVFSEPTYINYQKEGRGTGRGDDYKRWHNFSDVSSHGASFRLRSRWTHNREVHLFSKLEYSWFVFFDWLPEITDIREQFPLPIEKTLEIADKLRIAHPTHPQTKFPTALTTDLVLTRRRTDGRYVDEARTIKYSGSLNNNRTLEKFEIERRYYEEQGVDWKILAEKDLPQQMVRNIEILRCYVSIRDRLPIEQVLIDEIQDFMTERVLKEEIFLDILDDADEKFMMPSGTSLTIAFYLLANRIWQIDMNLPLVVHEPLVLIR
jgi:hypothetical protein